MNDDSRFDTVSLIIPCRNEEAAVPKLLAAIAAQTRHPDEVIVVDSASTDRTVEVARSFADRLPIRIVTPGEKGLALARNTGGHAATSDLLIFLDADTTLRPDFIKNVLTEMHARSLQNAAVPQDVAAAPGRFKRGMRFMNHYMRTMSRTPWPIALGSCIVTSKRTFEALQGFDPGQYIMEDYDYARRAKQHDRRFATLRTAVHAASMRRYEEADPAALRKLYLRGLYGELYRYTHGLKVDKEIYTYEMGGSATPTPAPRKQKPRHGR